MKLERRNIYVKNSRIGTIKICRHQNEMRDAFECESSRLRNEMCRRTGNFPAALNIKLDCISSMSTLGEALRSSAVIEYRPTYNRLRLL